MEMIEGRISDASILRLVRKCISVGVIDDGRLLQSETGTGQGQIINPLLANVYLSARWNWPLALSNTYMVPPA
jgi:retron-type reverse transcriptase